MTVMLEGLLLADDIIEDINEQIARLEQEGLCPSKIICSERGYKELAHLPGSTFFHTTNVISKVSASKVTYRGLAIEEHWHRDLISKGIKRHITVIGETERRNHGLRLGPSRATNDRNEE